MGKLKYQDPIAKAVKLALMTAAVATSFSTASVFAEEEEAESSDDEKITIVGSRIKRSDIEGPSPIVVLDIDDIKEQGFSNVYEAVQSVASNTGSQQGQGASGSFTQNAETVNLRGLGPNRTLVLLNGRRVANYPRPFNGQNNVFNLASIPLSAVERIEIINGGQSAIYGSDAMAGVMNIITKSDVEGTTVNVYGSATEAGGGDSQRVNLVTGGASEDFSWTLALDFTNQEMLRGKDRDWLDDRFDGLTPFEDLPEYIQVPQRRVMAMNFNYWSWNGWQYIDPVGECRAPYELANRPARGNYCGGDTTGNNSIISDREGVSAYLNMNYEINSDHTLFSDIMYWKNDARTMSLPFYDTRFVPDGYGHLFSGYIYTESANAGNNNGPGYPTYIYMQRTFTFEDMGGIDNAGTLFEDEMINITVGLEGVLFDDYDYTVYGSYSQTDNRENEWKLTEEGAAAYFIGREAPGVNPYLSYLRLENIFGPLGQDGFNQIFDMNDAGGTASVTNFGATLTGDLFQMEAGPVQFAATAEFSREDYDIELHPRTLNTTGMGWANLTGQEGVGERDRTSLAVEASFPLLDTLTATVAARYDDYDDDTDVKGASTYQLGIEYRPTDDLLIRAAHATTFRAPDLHQVNAAESGYFLGITDQWLAAVCDDINAGGDGSSEGLPADAVASATFTCDEPVNFWNPNYTVQGVRGGEKNLQEEEGETSSIGFVWSISDDITWTLDYWSLTLENEVVGFPSTVLFRWERECRNGTRDANDATCQNIFNDWLPRNGYSATNPNQLGTDLLVNTLAANYVNAALREQDGLDSSLTIRHETENFGTFSMETQWNHVLKYDYQSFEGEDISDWRDELIGADFRSRMNTTYGWRNDNWQVTIQQIRYGSTTNSPDAADFVEVDFQRFAPWFVYNLGVTYNINEDQRIRFGVNNVRDSKPRRDASMDNAQYGMGFDVTLYPATFAVMGRTFNLDYQITF